MIYLPWFVMLLLVNGNEQHSSAQRPAARRSSRHRAPGWEWHQHPAEGFDCYFLLLSAVLLWSTFLSCLSLCKTDSEVLFQVYDGVNEKGGGAARGEQWDRTSTHPLLYKKHDHGVREPPHSWADVLRPPAVSAV